MTTRARTAAALAILAPVLCVGSAGAQDTAVTMTGECERMIVAGLDITQNCKQKLTNTVARGRISFDFAAWDGQTLSFGGVGAQQEATELTEQLQPISIVVPGRKDKDAIVRNPAPAVGACRFSVPAPGKTKIDCEATSQGKTYAGTFVTEAKAPPEGGENRAKP